MVLSLGAIMPSRKHLLIRGPAVGKDEVVLRSYGEHFASLEDTVRTIRHISRKESELGRYGSLLFDVGGCRVGEGEEEEGGGW